MDQHTRRVEAIRALIGRSVEVERTPSGPGRTSYVVRELGRPSEEEDFRFFRSSVQVTGDFAWRAKPEEGEAGEMAEDAPVEERAIGTVEGICSSTSRDWYGTEMSRDCLADMAAQLSSDRGVPLLPTHGSFMSVPEWDSVIGTSVEAEVRKADVADPFDRGEQGYVLDARFALMDVDKAKELRARVEAGQRIGMSIGGWFRALEFVYSEETDEVERVIVMGVTLDHVTATRMPANPDSMGLSVLRSRLSPPAPSRAVLPEQERAAPVPEPPPAPQTLDTSAVAGDDVTRSAPPIPEDHPEEDHMTEQQIEALIGRAVQQSTEASAEVIGRAVKTAVDETIEPFKAEVERRMDALESEVRAAKPKVAVTPDAVVESDAEKVLRARVASLEKQVETMADVAVRRGIHTSDPRNPSVPAGLGAEAAIRSLAQVCVEQGQGRALAAIVERHAATLAEEDGHAPFDGVGSLRSLQALFAAGLRAAEVDGLIGKPATVHWH